MKKITVCLILLGAMQVVNAQKINLGKAASVVSNGAKALSFTNEDAIKLSKESVDWMDKNNKVAGPKDPYTVRLNKLFSKHKSQDGLNLNYKVYLVKDINAFACADGSVRVFSSLMDIMTDDELLAVIGHEIGHVKKSRYERCYEVGLFKSGGFGCGFFSFKYCCNFERQPGWKNGKCFFRCFSQQKAGI